MPGGGAACCVALGLWAGWRRACRLAGGLTPGIRPRRGRLRPGLVRGGEARGGAGGGGVWGGAAAGAGRGGAGAGGGGGGGGGRAGGRSAARVAGRFPDGQLHVNLRGYGAEGAAVTPEEVTGWFLAALGVPAAQIPADAQARSGLYRSVLAGRRVLIVLDNARDAAQVRPLLPGSPGCLVVVTSPSALAGLAAAEGARPLQLGPLRTEEGVRLLAAPLGGEPVAAQPG